ncbi:MAG: HAMP domain-containing histidine kinase [Verrucomicrobiota bacterium]|nr:HAMP domain-containing histidine kinase [Verrucomicrobiota bacterium]
MKTDDLAPRAHPLLASWQTAALRFTDRFVIAAWRDAPEQKRLARLIIRFGFLGFIFGMSYALFYWCIAHYWGAGIILLCSFGFCATPFLLRATRSLSFAGNLLAAIMTFGFAALCAVEGGLRGHAVAWLASVPLCALLVAGKDSARIWTIICFAVVSAAVFAELKDIPVPVTYDPAWHPLVNSAGYAGLIIFMFALGMIFETSRERAFRKMEEALRQLGESNEKLVTLNKEKTEFLGIVSHDLRNPLTTVIAFSQILESNERPAEVPKMSRAIHAAGARMRDLITNLLDANAVEEGRFSCKLERCEVDALVTQSIENNQMNAIRKRIDFEVASATGLALKADQSTTVQVLDNLISNAIKYSPMSTTVRIRTATDNGQVLIAVQDEGPGLSEGDQTKLFQKFTRLSAQPTGGESSTGLGLSIVKRMAEAMAGSIACESVLGHGATFTVRLPGWDQTP